MTGEIRTLPVPQRERWQPLRLGLVDVFHYDYEEFWFRDGHLLLRGNNGTGKSKVLALTLPFLLDANLAAHRVEPDGDPSKRMEWNLLLGGRYDERLGYTWLEFGRRAADGRPEYLTLGCGMKAVTGKGVADHWYFTASGRVGVDVWLVSSTGTTLTRDRLDEQLAGAGRVSGRVYRSAEAYRRAVDEALFQLGEYRYDAMVNLLVQLRQPQLSKRPDETKLSGALSEALAPLNQDVLLDIAAAFHDLEQQRDELAAARDTAQHVDRFRIGYRQYAAVLARRQGRALRTAYSEYEAANTRLGHERTNLAEKQEAERRCQAELTGVVRALAADVAAHQELGKRAELSELNRAERLAETARTAAVRAARVGAEALETLARRRAGYAAAEQAVSESRSAVSEAARAAGTQADAAGLRVPHSQLVAPLDQLVAPRDRLAAPLDIAEPDEIGPDEIGLDEVGSDEIGSAVRALRRGSADAADRRDAAVGHVRGLVGEYEAAAAALTAAARAVDEATAERDAAAERRTGGRANLSGCVEQLVKAWRSYLDSLQELRRADAEDVLAEDVPAEDVLAEDVPAEDVLAEDVIAELSDWAEELAGPNPAQQVLAQRASAVRTALANEYAETERERAGALAALAALTDERDRLLAGEQAGPPLLYTRSARDSRPGAPLWRVVDFVPGVPDGHRAGVEAALESAGLLDAWLAPDGTVLDPETFDVLLHPDTPVEHSLAAILHVAIDPADPGAAAVAPSTVEAVLAGIGLGAQDTPAWVDPDGRWRLGPAEGRWHKPAAEYLGHAAREQARRRRLAELEELVPAAQADIERIAHLLDELQQRQHAVEAELTSGPSDQPVRDAHAELALADRDLQVREAKLVAAAARHTTAAGTAREAQTQLAETAAELALPTDRPGLEVTSVAVSRYRTAVVSLAADAGRYADWLVSLKERQADLASAEQSAQERAKEAEQTEVEAVELEAARDALRETLGATVDELTHRLAELSDAIKAGRAREEMLLAQKDQLRTEVGRAEGTVEELTATLTSRTEVRDRSVEALRRFAATGLLAVAVPPDLEVPPTDRPWAPDPAVRLARRVEAALSNVDADDGAWNRVQKEITTAFNALAEGLSRHGHHAHADLLDDRYVVAVTYQGTDRTPDALAALLADDVEHRQRLLSAREREVIEEHLVNEVASHLHELIADAESQVAAMNAELAERPTSTGVRLRLRWLPRADGPAGLATARARLLRQSTDAWAPEDRDAVAEFLQQQIAAVRAANEHGTWLEHLTTALDYRGWHRFAIERWQDGQWRPAAGPASGGERVLTVMLPMFAAASAHYRTAHVHAPRLVLLDEAFAGVDDDARAKTLGLLATFDLDYALTSEREWGCYPTVPGLSICHLVRREGIDAVYVARWEWDGRTREAVEAALPSMAARSVERAQPQPPTLFADGAGP